MVNGNLHSLRDGTRDVEEAAMEVNDDISNLEILSLENTEDLFTERNVAEMFGGNQV